MEFSKSDENGIKQPDSGYTLKVKTTKFVDADSS